MSDRDLAFLTICMQHDSQKFRNIRELYHCAFPRESLLERGVGLYCRLKCHKSRCFCTSNMSSPILETEHLWKFMHIWTHTPLNSWEIYWLYRFCSNFFEIVYSEMTNHISGWKCTSYAFEIGGFLSRFMNGSISF